MQGALALQIILLEMYLGEKGVFFAIQHNLRKVGWPNKVDEVTSTYFSWRITTTGFSFKINTFFFLKYINHVIRKKTISLSAGFIMNIKKEMWNSEIFI